MKNNWKYLLFRFLVLQVGFVLNGFYLWLIVYSFLLIARETLHFFLDDDDIGYYYALCPLTTPTNYLQFKSPRAQRNRFVWDWRGVFLIFVLLCCLHAHASQSLVAWSWRPCPGEGNCCHVQGEKFSPVSVCLYPLLPETACCTWGVVPAPLML